MVEAKQRDNSNCKEYAGKEQEGARRADFGNGYKHRQECAEQAAERADGIDLTGDPCRWWPGL